MKSPLRATIPFNDIFLNAECPVPPGNRIDFYITLVQEKAQGRWNDEGEKEIEFLCHLLPTPKASSAGKHEGTGFSTSACECCAYSKDGQGLFQMPALPLTHN